MTELSRKESDGVMYFLFIFSKDILIKVISEASIPPLYTPQRGNSTTSICILYMNPQKATEQAKLTIQIIIEALE